MVTETFTVTAGFSPFYVDIKRYDSVKAIYIRGFTVKHYLYRLSKLHYGITY